MNPCRSKAAGVRYLVGPQAHTGDDDLTRIAASAAFAAVPTQDLGQGDRINLGVAGIIGRLPAAAEALGSLNAALRSNGTLPRRLVLQP